MKPQKNTLKRLWTPVYIEEGEVYPIGYGSSRWIPMDENAEVGVWANGTYRWRKAFYPIPVSLILTFYWYMRFKLKRGFALPPECYRTHVFEVHSHCPHCNKPIYQSNP